MNYNRHSIFAAPSHHYRLASLTADYDAPLASIIRAVSAEFGLTADKGYSVADPQLDCLSQLYQAPGTGYFLLMTEDGELMVRRFCTGARSSQSV